MAGDNLKVVRAERQVRLIDRFSRFMSQRGAEASMRSISPAFLVPLLDCATLETDDDLQDVWARMLANAADAGSTMEMRTAFISMLSQMARFDIQILAALHKAAEAHGQDPDLATNCLPEAVGLASGGGIKNPRIDVEISLANLHRLGCLLPIPTYGGLSFGLVRVTKLGAAFVLACSSVE